ncbi:MAG: GNAT family N-acetyltransferase [Candidatus Zixiibacteriota bacterium]|nr:MAG: GNAT family N-acetyltransferase [candidate division Zixibacteria bacterium]
MLVFTSDKKRLNEHFHKDPVLFSYHIGDLDDFYFPHCQWGAVYSEAQAIDDAVLVYTGLTTPAVLAFGLTDRFEELLADMIDLLPPAFYSHYQAEYMSIFSRRYRERRLGTHIKMRLESFKPVPVRPTYDMRPLDHGDEKQLSELYACAYPGNYFHPRMLTTGKYFGVLESGRILAVSGVHVCSDEYRIAVLGNIATHPDFRGQGLATVLSSHLVAELVDEGKLVCLNVKEDNAAAIRCYEKLGFRKVHEYEEAFFELATG